jgi:hypothetical protein
VIDAVACMKTVNLDDLPDTGTLRGDLLGMIKPHSIEDADRKLKVMTGLLSMLSRSPELADAAYQAITDPRARATRLFLQRAIDRGEIPAATDIQTLSLVSASMASYRTLFLRKPVDREFLLSVIDGVILPAVGLQV